MRQIKNYDIMYREVLDNIRQFGVLKSNRTGTNTLSIFNTIIKADISDGTFPLMTCRKIHFKSALIELFWILGILQAQNPITVNGRPLHRNNVQYLKREGCNYWDAWADENGDLGPVYGEMLMEWPTISSGEYSYDVLSYINQIQNIVDTLRSNPDDRRLVATMWNPAKLQDMALPPCHHTMEFYSRPVDGKRYLDVRWIQRSADFPIGVPFDLCLYALLDIMICKMTGHLPGNVYGLFGDSHIYVNQLEGVNEMLNSPLYDPPKFEWSGPDYVENINDFKMEWFNISDYNYFKTIKMPVSV